MSDSEVLDTNTNCSEEQIKSELKEEEGEVSSSGMCDSPGKLKSDVYPESSTKEDEDGVSSSGECDSPVKLKSNTYQVNVKEEEDGISSSGECDDSPGPASKDEDKLPEEIVSKKENCTLLRSIDGELDYEEEIDEDKEKKVFDDDKKDETESEKKDDGELDDEEDEEKGKEEKGASGTEKKANDTEKEDSMEEGEDEGEISDDDLEEGEVKDASPKPETTRQVCRFYGRGQCFYGNACRFLHLNHEKGQYNMFAAPQRFSQGYGYGPVNLIGPSNPMMNERPAPRMEYVPPPLPIPIEPSPVESAWERGLREAKELVKKANKRKEEEPDFDKKKLDLSIHVNERSSPDYDKENEFFYSRSHSKRNEAHFKKYEEPPFDVYENDRAAREHFRSGRFENFEVRYTREEVPRDRRGRERSRGRMSNERERYNPKEGRNKDRMKDDRVFDAQMRARAFDYVDPWRRSKTPKARRSRSRSGSYSSVSSAYSYSDRSSRSSGSYSRSSSRSSGASSRSPPTMHKRKPSPVAEVGQSPKGASGRFPVIKKKPPTRPTAARSSSSRSRTPSRTPSISRSRSRSYSRSISMDSVSSASSSVSHSSSGSGPRRNRTHGSVLRKSDEKLPLDKLDTRNISSYDREEDSNREPMVHEDMYASEVTVDTAPSFPSFQHLIPDSKGKSQHKQPIKLTLLNKATLKQTSLPKKELDRSKLLGDQKSEIPKQDVPSYSSGSKRPLSPSLSATNVKSNAPVPKKSASSRRDELLKQLKAVEDAIARKRAKFC